MYVNMHAFTTYLHLQVLTTYLNHQTCHVGVGAGNADYPRCRHPHDWVAAAHPPHALPAGGETKRALPMAMACVSLSLSPPLCQPGERACWEEPSYAAVHPLGINRKLKFRNKARVPVKN